jgi:hypothetical protein
LFTWENEWIKISAAFCFGRDRFSNFLLLALRSVFDGCVGGQP